MKRFYQACDVGTIDAYKQLLVETPHNTEHISKLSHSGKFLVEFH